MNLISCELALSTKPLIRKGNNASLTGNGDTNNLLNRDGNNTISLKGKGIIRSH